MKKSCMYRMVLSLTVIITTGCTSSAIPPDMAHIHGKNYHQIKKKIVPPAPPPGTKRHWHGKNLHKTETTQ